MYAPDAFSRRLLPDETLLWADQPAQGIRLTAEDLFLVPFNLLFVAFVLFWGQSVIPTGVPWLFRLWGLPLLAMVAYFLAGRFLVDAWCRRRTWYAVTSLRILVARTGPFPSFAATSRALLADLQLREHADGRGTILFGPQPMFPFRRAYDLWTPGQDSSASRFVGIADARHVFDLIQRARPVPG